MITVRRTRSGRTVKAPLTPKKTPVKKPATKTRTTRRTTITETESLDVSCFLYFFIPIKFN